VKIGLKTPHFHDYEAIIVNGRMGSSNNFSKSWRGVPLHFVAGIPKGAQAGRVVGRATLEMLFDIMSLF
jgi:hypothetical protein